MITPIDRTSMLYCCYLMTINCLFGDQTDPLHQPMKVGASVNGDYSELVYIVYTFITSRHYKQYMYNYTVKCNQKSAIFLPPLNKEFAFTCKISVYVRRNHFS
jgi:hypothetical protein